MPARRGAERLLLPLSATTTATATTTTTTASSNHLSQNPKPDSLQPKPHGSVVLWMLAFIEDSWSLLNTQSSSLSLSRAIRVSASWNSAVQMSWMPLMM